MDEFFRGTFSLPDCLNRWHTGGLSKHVGEWRRRGVTVPSWAYSGTDAALLWAMIRVFKPNRVLEVGSGFSTRVANAAIEANADEASGGNADGSASRLRAKHTCIEPFNQENIGEALNIEVKEEKVQRVALEYFSALESGDILFLDTSHVITPYGDTIFELLFILPVLKPGVIIHVHDMYVWWHGV